MKKYDYLFFDLDGTVTDSFESITKSFIYALDRFGIGVEDVSSLRAVVGPPLKDSFMNIFKLSNEESDRAVEIYRERYSKYCALENKLYKGINDVLCNLYKRGYKIVLATAKPEKYANEILKYFDILKYFYFVGGASFDETRNNKINVIRYIIENISISDKSKIVMIGDTKHDMEASFEMGIDAIGVLYGYGKEEELSYYPNVFLAQTPEMLYNYIIGLEKG